MEAKKVDFIEVENRLVDEWEGRQRCREYIE
jgi:hypothetical protein